MSWWTDIRAPLVSGLVGVGAGIAGGPAAGIAAGAATYGAMTASEGSQRTAEAQGQMAEAQLSEARRTREQALGYAMPSSTELEGQRRLLELQDQILGRTNRELDFLSRGLAAQTGGQSLQGEGLFSDLIARNRQAQRSQLEASLRARFGAGYATTSAGMAALNQFDQQTVDIGVQAIPQFLQSAYGAIGAPLTQAGNIAARQVGAINQTPITPYAGAPYVGQVQAGQAQQALFGQLLNTGTQLGVGYMMSRSPAAQKPEVPAQTLASKINSPVGEINYNLYNPDNMPQVSTRP